MIPNLLMTFAANDLKGVKTETDKIWKSVKNNALVKATKVNNTTIDTLAEAILKCGKDLFMFHFGGHADANGIVLDGFRNLDKLRLSNILLSRKDHNVQLVFLNGCLSYGHVGTLTARGVKAIIATNVNVNDAEAARIASFFYQTFFEADYTLKEAFEFAEATVKGNNSFPIIVNPGAIDENQAMPSSWTLFIHADHTKVLDWKLADFVKSTNKETPSVSQAQNDPSAITQNHSGNGDNVAGHKIGRQINMGSGSTYIENAQTHTPYLSPQKPKNVKTLVVEGKLQEALEVLATQSDDNQIVLLQSRLNRLERDENAGTMDPRDANLERNRITNSILSLLKDLS